MKKVNKMDEEIKKLLESQNSLLLNIYSSQVLLLVKQKMESMPDDFKKESSIKSEVQNVFRELKEVKDLVKEYYF